MSYEQTTVKALLHGAIFHATCLATALRDKLHGSLDRVTCCVMVKIVARQVARTIALCNMLCKMVKIVARQVAPIVAESRIGFYFLQRLQQLFSALHRVTPFQQLVSQCFHNNDCERMRVIQCSSFYRKKMHKRVAACNTPHLATAMPHKSSLRDKLHEKLHRVTGS